MRNNNFMNKYNTIKSIEELEKEKSIKLAPIAKKVCDYWKSRMLSKTTLDLTEQEKDEIQEVFKELETEIRTDEMYTYLLLGEYATIDDFDIIRRINRRINHNNHVGRDIMSHIDDVTGAEITMEFSQDYILIINHRPSVKNTEKGYEDWYIKKYDDDFLELYEYLYCTPDAIKTELEKSDKSSKNAFLWPKNRLEALKKYEEKYAIHQENEI